MLNPKKFKIIISSGLTVILSVLIIYGIARAGSLTPSALPAATAYTLTDIYTRLTTNAAATEANHLFAPSGVPAATLYTLKQIYDAIPNINPSNLLSSTTYLGVTGTIASRGAFSLTASSSSQSVTAGYYSGGTLSGDTDLAAVNVKKGVDVFEISGSYSGYAGTGWTGGTTITQALCDAQNPTWYWFEDANGDGDVTDPEDGICIKAVTVSPLSWNGAEQVATTSITAQAATGGTNNSITKSSAGWTTNSYTNMVVKITSGTAVNSWGIIKSNTVDTLTVYGSWLDPNYTSSSSIPDATSVFTVARDGLSNNDNSWIGDWTCSGSFPNGTVSWGSFPTLARVGGGYIAIASADCYDGVRDLLPTEISRAVKTGTAAVASSTGITDFSLSLETNGWVGQKVLITAGTGIGGNGRIESNTATRINVADWTGGIPGVGSAFAIIYLIPHASYNPTTLVDGDTDDQLNGVNGPLTREALDNWKGTRLPTAKDFFGYCGYKDGGSNYENTVGIYTSYKDYGNKGGQVGRTDEFFDLANQSGNREWLSEQYAVGDALLAGGDACSYTYYTPVSNGYNFRAVFRP